MCWCMGEVGDDMWGRRGEVATNDCEGDTCPVQYTRILRVSARILRVISNPDILDENPNILEINPNPILSLYDDAHDDIIYNKISLGMLT